MKYKKAKSFEEIKKRMITVFIVIYLDFEKSFILYMDVLKEDIRIVFYQKDDQDKKRIIACMSRTLN